MEDYVFLEELQRGILLPEPTPLEQSAFVPYMEGVPFTNSNEGSENMNNGMVELLQSNPVTTANYEHKASEKERSYRHMINERQRREKQKQNYAALHSLLPSRTKKDKKSIIQTATSELQELKHVHEELLKRHRQLEMKSLVIEEDKTKLPTVRLLIQNPSSGIDSTFEILRCIKRMGLTVKTFRFEYSALGDISVTLQIETKIEAAMVEEAVQKALSEVVDSKSFSYHQQIQETSRSNLE